MSNERFDHLWNRMLGDHTAMVSHYNGTRNSMRLFRKSAYRFAVGLLYILTHHHDEFVKFAKSNGDDIDAWFSEHFAPIEDMGDHRQRLLRAIEDGMTENQYVNEGPAWLAKRGTRKPTTAHVDLTTTDKVDDQRSDAEKLADARATVKAMKSELLELRRNHVIIAKENDRLVTIVNRLERSIQSWKSKTA